MDIEDQRAVEIGKYQQAYKQAAYAMGDCRKDHAIQVLDETISRRSYLDIGCGRGEMMERARQIGYVLVMGTEVVTYLLKPYIVRYAIASALPFDAAEFDTVSCFDVLEHLLPEDTIPALQEINRVANKQIILTANNQPSMCNGQDLHINKREYHEWDALIRKTVDGAVQWLPRPATQISETWLVTKGI